MVQKTRNFISENKIKILCAIATALIPIVFIKLSYLGEVLAWASEGGIEKQREFVTRSEESDKLKEKTEIFNEKIAEKTVIFNLNIKGIKDDIKEIDEDVKEIDEKVNTICIALGVNPKTEKNLRGR